MMERAEGLLGGKFHFKRQSGGTIVKTKVVCSICRAELNYHRSISSLTYHLKAKHPTESRPRLDGRQPTLHDFSSKITRSVCEKVTDAVEKLRRFLSERMTALVKSYYRKLLKFSVNTTLIILDLVLWMEVTSSLSPGRSVSRECYSCLMRRCRYTMVVLWGIVVPHIAHAQTQTVYGIRLNININISGLSSRIM